MSKYLGWLDFIIRNFKPGTSTEIANHIEKEARKQGFKPNNKTIVATVRRILPESTLNPGPSPERKNVRQTFYYDLPTKTYHLVSKLNTVLEKPKFKIEEKNS